MRLAAFALLCLLFSGCSYGPAHLDAFYATRNQYQGMIDDIEKRYNMPSRDVDKGQTQELKSTIAQLRKENELLGSQLDLLNDQWFKSLSPENQIKWRMQVNQSRLNSLRNPEAKDGPAPGGTPPANVR